MGSQPELPFLWAKSHMEGKALELERILISTYSSHLKFFKRKCNLGCLGDSVG